MLIKIDGLYKMKKAIIITVVLFCNLIFGQNNVSMISESFKNPEKNRLDSIAKTLDLKEGKTIRIFALFTINENGDIVDIKARAKHRAFEQEAIRVIKELPRMTPAVLNGKRIERKYSLPIIFQVETKRMRKSRERKEKRKKEKEQQQNELNKKD